MARAHDGTAQRVAPRGGDQRRARDSDEHMTALRSELRPFRLALRSPFVTGGVSVRVRAGFLVSITAGGHTGWGEASPLPGWSRNTLLQTETALRRALAGLDSGSEDAVGAVIASLEDAPHARAAVSGAWADLRASQAGRVLAAHLTAGGPGVQDVDDAGESDGTGSVVDTIDWHPAAPTVAVNALVAVPVPADVESAAHAAARDGFGAVKLKVGAVEPAVDVDRVRAARAGLGPMPELRLDANGAWDESTAVDLLRRLEDCDIAFCEEPVSSIEAIAAVGRHSPVPVAVDESMRGEADAAKAIGLGIGTLVVKPQALGGPGAALFIAARALDAGTAVVVTSFLDSAVGVAHALHVAAAVDAAAARRRAHGLATAQLLADDVAQPPQAVDGAMRLPTVPGLGIVPR